MDTPDTPAQAEARKRYDKACRDLAAAAVRLKEVQAQHAAAHDEYMFAWGIAQQAGVLK